LTPNHAGQTYAGGSFVYTQTLTNTGNVTEGNGTVSSIALSTANNQAGWTSVLYYDANNNGTLDGTDRKSAATSTRWRASPAGCPRGSRSPCSSK